MIYLVEDDASIRELVIYALNNSGFEAQGFDAPSAFWRAMAQQVPSMILLDIMLPEEDGLQILKKLRQNPATRRTPGDTQELPYPGYNAYRQGQRI